MDTGGSLDAERVPVDETATSKCRDDRHGRNRTAHQAAGLYRICFGTMDIPRDILRLRAMDFVGLIGVMAHQASIYRQRCVQSVY